MSESKKINFESVILTDLTLAKEGYDPINLAPKSNKHIWASCRYCGEPNRVIKSKYTLAGNSNAHAECRKKELSEVNSSFSDPVVKEKIKNKLIEKYGVDHSSKIDSAKIKKRETHLKNQDSISPPKNIETKEVISINDAEQVQEIISKIREFYSGEIIKDSDIIAPKELSIYIPEKKLAVNYISGHNNSEAVLGRKEAQYRHYNKTNACFENGIRIIHIFETEYVNNRELFIYYVKNLMGMNVEKINARSCEVTNVICPKFFDENHLQGQKKSVEQYFNLEYKGEVVASMTASQHHEKNARTNKVIVLSRFCSKRDSNVIGGASRLFKYFVEWSKAHNYDVILSWSDSCISDGGLYEKLGFYLEKENKPDFKWWDENVQRIVTKQSKRHIGKAKPIEYKRDDWYKEHRLYRIWNAGKKTWYYKLKEGMELKKLYYCKGVSEEDIKVVERVINCLDDGMLKKEYRDIKNRRGINCDVWGHCYVASEALYHLLGDSWKIKNTSFELDGNKIVHWWLERGDSILDATAGQLPDNFDYNLGKNAAFLTKKASKRCEGLIDRVNKQE